MLLSIHLFRRVTREIPVDDFEIKDGVLVKYHGSGGDIGIPKSVTSIGDGAFAGCTGLTSISIQDGVTSIGKDAFAGCSNLVEFDGPQSLIVKTVGDIGRSFSGTPFADFVEENIATWREELKSELEHASDKESNPV